MEEALDALQAEREAKYAIKKDLDAKINSESIFNLSNLAFSIKGATKYLFIYQFMNELHSLTVELLELNSNKLIHWIN